MILRSSIEPIEEDMSEICLYGYPQRDRSVPLSVTYSPKYWHGIGIAIMEKKRFSGLFCRLGHSADLFRVQQGSCCQLIFMSWQPDFYESNPSIEDPATLSKNTCLPRAITTPKMGSSVPVICQEKAEKRDFLA